MGARLGARICSLLVLVCLAISASAAELQGGVIAGGGTASLTAEGGSDWVHWGLDDASSVNRKAGVTAQISGLTNVVAGPGGRFFGNGSVHTSLGWTDGTPTPSEPGFTGGLYYPTAGSGYEFTVPAGGTQRTLKVYLGGFKASSQVQATLSDGSAAPFSTTIGNLNGVYHHVVTLTFQADAPDATLTFRHTRVGGTGNVTIHGAALDQGGAVNQPPSIAQIGDKFVTIGDGLGFTVSATDTDGPAPLEMTLSGSSPALPAAATYTDNGDGTGTFAWTPLSGDEGVYDVTFRATDDGGAGASDEQTITLSVSGSSSASLSGSADAVTNPGDVDLTADGPSDWVHWGLDDASSVNRKAGVTAQISGLTNVVAGPGGRFFGNGSVHTSLGWTDGTPTPSEPGFTGGLYYLTAGSGYEFTVPAGGTQRTLKVYLGGFKASSQLQATLSDGSAAPFSTTIGNLNGVYHHVVTLTFQADAPDATLTFRHTRVGGTGNVTIHGAALDQGGAVNQPPSIAQIGDQFVTIGDGLGFTVSATDTDGPAPLEMTLSGSSPALPAAATYTDNGDGTAAFAWTPLSGDEGVYDVTFRATDDGGAGASDEQTITLSVSGSSSASLSGSADAVTNPGDVDLTADGPSDWVHWGLDDASSVNRKAGVTAQISGLTNVVAGPGGRFFGNGSVHTSLGWTDGTPTPSEPGFTGGLYYLTAGSGYEFTVPAGGTQRTLKVYLGGFKASSQLQATLSDGSAAPFSTTIGNLNGVYHHVVTLTFQADAPDATLTFRHTRVGGTGNVTIHGAALAGGSSSFSLPYTESFDQASLADWSIVDETARSSDWQITGGALRQNAQVESVFAFDQSYHLGTYAVRPEAASLTDYRFRAEARFLSAGAQEDLGIVFRWQDVDNFYRLTMNARYGFTRLEKKVNGVFSPLATDSRGYRPGSPVTIEVTLDGPTILVSLDGDSVFAVEDASLDAGTFGLYTQGFARFDDLLVEAPGSDAAVTIGTPLAHFTDSGTAIDANAVVRNVPAGGLVQFLLDGSLVQNDATAPYAVSYSDVPDGNHTVAAVLLDDANFDVARDTNVLVGTGGRLLVSIGDSITNGVGDNFEQDNVSALERVIAAGGYQATLTDLLNTTGVSATALVVNEGIGGDETFDAESLRIDSILERHPTIDVALIGLGTNDALAQVPSGAGCSGGGCDGTFKGNLQALVDRIRWSDYPANAQPSGIQPVVALIPPAWNSANPWTSATNDRIRAYNDVIATEINGIQLGPDLFDFFLSSSTANYLSLFTDTLHPNGLGYLIMAYLWHNALEPASALPVPFLLEDLASNDTPLLKQNLLGPGDRYYVDQAHTLTAVPAVLDGGRWIMTANASVTNDTSNYVSFTLDRPATVYIGYDGGATDLPQWMDGFSDTGSSITTSDPQATILRLYARSYPAGTVTLGGTAQAPASGADAAYTAVVVEE